MSNMAGTDLGRSNKKRTHVLACAQDSEQHCSWRVAHGLGQALPGRFACCKLPCIPVSNAQLRNMRVPILGRMQICNTRFSATQAEGHCRLADALTRKITCVC